LEAEPSLAYILLQFRDGHATDLRTLLQAVGFKWPSLGSEIGYVFRAVLELFDAGLLRADDPKFHRMLELKTWAVLDEPGVGDSRIRVTELVPKIQAALDLSIAFLASFDRNACMVVEPLFGLPGKLANGLDVFVLMPFNVDMLPVYEDHIEPTCTSMGLTVRRGDDCFTAHSVVQDVWKAIVGARLIVADCTDRNPNVFYEIGLAHTIGKPTILLTQRAEDIPFDLRHLRYIEYQLSPRGMKEFETKFKERLRNVP
jgi:hypothetical protein